MDQINIEDIVLKHRTALVKRGTKHPFVYSDGNVDLSALGEKKLKQLRKESDENIILEVFKYLKNPLKYTNNCNILNPQYL